MLTDLFAMAHGIAPSVVEGVVPPACRTGVTAAAPPETGGDETVIETPEWRPRRPARHFVPALSVLTPLSCPFRFELSIATPAGWTPWIASAAIGGDPFEPLATDGELVRCDIDVFTTVPTDAVRLRVRLRGADRTALLAASWLVTLSASDLAPLDHRPPGPPRAAVSVPARSQMVEAEAIRRRICSPTSVAMVLERWGRRIDTLVLAAEIFHPALDRYGVWPAAISVAGRHGIAGYLLRFPDWGSAAWCLAAGLPVIASVTYGRGELPGAALDETEGHLLVLSGYDDGEVLVNDPAGPAHDAVSRRVRRDALERVWLERAGVGYVLFPVQIQVGSDAAFLKRRG